MSHRNARLTVFGRQLLVERGCSGRPIAHVAAEMGISRATAHKWIRRWRAEGPAGLHDRPSRPRTTPHRTSAEVEGLQPAPGPQTGPRPDRPDPGSARLDSPPHPHQAPAEPAGLDRPPDRHRDPPLRTRTTRRTHPRRREETRTDPRRRGTQTLGRQAGRVTRSQISFDYVHSAIDDHSRLAYSEIHPTRRSRPVRTSSPARPRSSTTMASPPSNGSLPTTPGPTAKAWPGKPSWQTSVRPAGSPAPTGPRPTAKQNASTAPCWRNGPTCGHTPQTTSGQRP